MFQLIIGLENEIEALSSGFMPFGAIIVENNNSFIDINEKGNDVNIFTESKDIVREKYKVIPMNYTKGLEFEKVIVIRKGMTNNEFYVACTRAVSELYVVV